MTKLQQRGLLVRPYVSTSFGRADLLLFFLLLSALLSFAASAQSENCQPAEPRVYWGDLHIHTSFSMDAYVWNNQLTPRDAYRFARGGQITTPRGQRLSLRRPLDFAAVTDHGEYFGAMQSCLVGALDTPFCQDLRKASQENSPRGFRQLFLPALLAQDPLCQQDAAGCRIASRDLWQRTIAAANEANEPCRFTAFVANEWSPSPDNLHWHRNLIYASDVVPNQPINSIDQPTQEDLWQALDDQCGVDRPGCRVLAIPHNTNLSMGGTFEVNAGAPQTLRQRARYERLLEIFQHKGNSECYADSSLTDEDCDFEQVLPIPLGRTLAQDKRPITAEERLRVSSGYARDTLGRGLLLAEQTGINPFVYGLIGSSDTHAGRPGDVEEATWQGAIGAFDEVAETRQSLPQYNPGGLVGVWAKQNTREALFEAMSRREVFATSGPRIHLRLDAGRDASCGQGADDQTPMGAAYEGQDVPTFVIRAQQDQVPLEELQIIKLTLINGKLQQRVQRFRHAGRADWCQEWRDREFVAERPALWYARVFQQQTTRWDGQGVILERAWSSPIWSSVDVSSP